MKTKELISELERNATIFQSMFTGTTISFQQWRPETDKWNIHEILCHLLDEEQFDFRARIKHTLETPEETMPSINPVGWVQEKNYAGWNYSETLNKFIQERKRSVLYLKELKNPNWQSSHHHPQLGVMTAEAFLFNWLAHDYLHIRQVNRYQYLYLKQNTGINLSYAGNW